MFDRNEMFDQMIDDSIEPMTIGFGTFYASDILYNCDPLAYRLSVQEFEEMGEEDE